MSDDASSKSADPEAAGSAEELALKKSEAEAASQPITPELSSALKGAPTEVQEIFSLMMASGPAKRRHPFFDKLTTEQLSQYLDYQREEERDEYQLRKSNRWFALGYTALGVALFVFLVVYLLQHSPDLLDDIMKLAIGFVGGLGIGYGAGKKRGES